MRGTSGSKSFAPGAVQCQRRAKLEVFLCLSLFDEYLSRIAFLTRRLFPRKDEPFPIERCHKNNWRILRRSFRAGLTGPQDPSIDLLKLHGFESGGEFAPELIEGGTPLVLGMAG